MRAGLLSRRVTYQTPSESADRYGDTPPATWTTVATYWAQIRSPTGREVYQATLMQAVVTHIVTLRYDPTVGVPLPTGRLVHGSKVYNIKFAADRDERNRLVDIMCTESVPDQQG